MFQSARFVKSLAYIISILIISLFVSYFAFAWTEPSMSPPGGNASPPINVSSVAQTKSGSLSVSTLYDTNNTNYFIDPDAPVSALLSGKVGIGTTNPNANLHIKGNPIGAAELRIESTGAASDIHFLNPVKQYSMGIQGTADLTVPNSFFIHDTYAGEYRFVVNPSGNVGIGATNPNAKLEVAGDVRFSGTAEGGQTNGLYLPNSDITVGGGTDGVFGFHHTGQGAGQINFGNPYWPPVTGWTMSINVKTNRVGIGTTTPNAKLQINGGDAAISTQGNGLILKATDGSNCYRVTVNNVGALNTALVTCP